MLSLQQQSSIVVIPWATCRVIAQQLYAFQKYTKILTHS